MEKELDLSFVEIVQKANKENRVLDTKEEKKGKSFLDRILKNSIQDENNSKRQKIHGEVYKGKGVTKEDVFTVGVALVGAVIVISGFSKVGSELTALSEYKGILNQKVESELNMEEKDVFNEQYNESLLDKYKNYKVAYDSLENSDYNIVGNRVDGNSNPYYKIDDDALIDISEKQVDALDIATDAVIEEFKGRGK